LYQLEYHMTTPVKSVLFKPSVAVAAVLTAWFTFGGSQIARAEDPETLSPPAQEMILVPAKDVHALQERVAYLEETVAALTESWQHIDTHRLCVSDDSGAETCITKPQLDALLASQANVAAISPPPAIVAVESVTVATMTDTSEPVPSAVSHDVAQTDQEPEYTGSITPRAPADERPLSPESESVPGEQP
jgi:hypothetical protein